MVTEKAKISSAAFVGEFRESTCSKAKINRSKKPIHWQLFVGKPKVTARKKTFRIFSCARLAHQSSQAPASRNHKPRNR
jgi:hypothetical protein